MYSYLEGKIEYQESSYIVIDVNGVGYSVFVPNPYSYEYTQKDVDKMYGAIEAALKESKARYNEPKKKDSKFKF